METPNLEKVRPKYKVYPESSNPSQPNNDDMNGKDKKLSEDSHRSVGAGQLAVRPKKERWSNKVEYILSLVGFAVGFGNVWRFSYYVQLNGGGAFLIPYFLMLILLGIPAFYLEVHIGKIAQVGPHKAMHRLVPAFGGAGVASIVTMVYITYYYSLLIAYILFYLFSSFQIPPAWSSQYYGNLTQQNHSILTNSCNESASELFYYISVAAVSPSIDDISGFSWKLMLCIIGAWTLIFICTFKGIKSFGKVAYVTTLFPYIVLFVLLVRGATFEGAAQGLEDLFIPDLSLLLNFKVWLQAGSQIFFSLSLGSGGNIVLASHLDQKSNVFFDVIFVSIVNSATSIYAAIVVFMILGHNAQCPNGSGVGGIVAGPGLVFIAFASALLDTPPASLWSVLFFLMMLSLGLSSQFPSLQALTEAARAIPYISRLHETLVSFIICVLFTLCSIIFVLGNGQYIFGLIDEFAASYSLFVVIFFEFIGVAWFFGVKKLLWYETDIKTVASSKGRLDRIRSNRWFRRFTYYFWSVSWKIVAPLIMLVIFSGSLIFQFLERPKYTAFQNYIEVSVPYPDWALAAIIFIILSTLLPVALGMLYEYKELWHMFKRSYYTLRRVLMNMSHSLGISKTQYYVIDNTMDSVHYSANEESVSLIKSDKGD